MSGLWRVTVDSWISDNADWYGRRIFLVDDANDLPTAVRKVSELPPQEYLGGGVEIHTGTVVQARNDYRIWAKVNKE